MMWWSLNFEFHHAVITGIYFSIWPLSVEVERKLAYANI